MRHRPRVAVRSAGLGLGAALAVFAVGTPGARSQPAQSADLMVRQAQSPIQPTVGKPVVYSLLITNKGPGPATNVRVGDSLPEGVQVISYPSLCSRGPGAVNCVLASLPRGSTRTLRITVRPRAAGTLTNRATATADQPDPVSANNSSKTTSVARSPLQRADSGCKSTTMTSGPKRFSTFVPQEGVGLVGWNARLRFTARDRCDHGFLEGSSRAYIANVDQKGGTLVTRLAQYRLNNGAWQQRGIIRGGVPEAVDPAIESSASFTTDGHLDMTRRTRITHVKLVSYVVFDDVPQGLRRVVCTLASRTCRGEIGS